MDKEVVVYLHNGKLLSYKKEHIWVRMRWMNLEPIIQSKVTQKERQIPYVNAYIRNLERWYWWSYSRGNKRDADIKDQLLDTVGEGEGGMIWDSGIYTEIYTLPYVRRMAGGNLLYNTGNPKLVLDDHLEGGMGSEVQKGGDVCMPMADSCLCMVEAITKLWSNYPPIKIKIF